MHVYCMCGKCSAGVGCAAHTVCGGCGADGSTSPVRQFIPLFCCPARREETLLQSKLATYAKFIGRFGLWAAVVASVAMTARFRWAGEGLERRGREGRGEGGGEPGALLAPRAGKCSSAPHLLVWASVRREPGGLRISVPPGFCSLCASR